MSATTEKTKRVRVSQMDLVAGILDLLVKLGVKDAESRVFNACIGAANLLVAEVNRESVRAIDGMGLMAWLASDDTGMSSKWMAHVCAGAPCGSIHDRGAYPHDPPDFGRCYRFLRAVPEARANMHKLAATGPVWARLVAQWDTLERLYEEELPTGQAPKLYSLMKLIEEPA